MAGGLSITVQQGAVLVNTGQAALVGSAATAVSGTLSAVAPLLTGQAGTVAIGAVTDTLAVDLRSRKQTEGGQSASQALSGAVFTGGTGMFRQDKTFALTGRLALSLQGVLQWFGRAAIAWNANPEPDVAGYRVYHGTSPGVTTQMVDIGNALSYQWNGLTPGQTHFFAVTAYDTSGNESAKSLEVSKAY